MFPGATLPSLLLAALCLVSRAAPSGEDKDSLVSLSLTTPPAGDSSEEDRRHASALLLDSGPSFSDASDTWTEADRLRAEEVSVSPSSQDVGTEATMSSEDLPLIFEPFEDAASVAMTPAAVPTGDAELERMVSVDTDRTSSGVRRSGAREPHPAEEHHGTTQPGDDITQRAVTHQALRVTSKPKTDTEDPKTEENKTSISLFAEKETVLYISDEDEEEDEEDLKESSISRPPPPVWVQRNQGLVRSWVELIREKAGYVSGMLAPVGIGIAGALLLVGALYSIRVLHRKRSNSFKHQRRKPPREVHSGPDDAMLLADSSEDEF